MGRPRKDGQPAGVRLIPRASDADVEAANFTLCLLRGTMSLSDICSILRIDANEAGELAKLSKENPTEARIVSASITVRSRVAQLLDERLRGEAK